MRTEGTVIKTTGSANARHRGGKAWHVRQTHRNYPARTAGRKQMNYNKDLIVMSPASIKGRAEKALKGGEA